MRIGTIVRVVMAATLTIGVVFTSSSYNARPATADTVENRSVFYRLKSKYQYGVAVVATRAQPLKTFDLFLCFEIVRELSVDARDYFP